MDMHERTCLSFPYVKNIHTFKFQSTGKSFNQHKTFPNYDNAIIMSTIINPFKENLKSVSGYISMVCQLTGVATSISQPSFSACDCSHLLPPPYTQQVDRL